MIFSSTTPDAGAATRGAAALARLRAILTVDARSLALFRILLALCLAVDFAAALVDFTALYSDAGILPRHAVLEFWPPAVTNSLYLMADHWAIVDPLLIIHAAAILALLVGWRSRLAAFLCFVFACSLQTRNFMVLQASDDLMRVLLVWSVLAPIGRRWSVDAALDETKAPRGVLTLGTIGLQWQALAVYLFGALIKSQSAVWYSAGTAVAMALADGTYGSDFGRLFLRFPALLRLADFGVLWLELLTPLLIWFPIRNTAVRLATLALLAVMHLSFLVFLHVGMFPLVSLTSLTLFLPGAVWDRLAARPRVRRAAAVRIYYDRDCLFCYKVALLFREFCLPRTVPVLPAQDHPTAGPLLAQHNSWVVFDAAGQPHLKWRAVALLWRLSPVLWPLGRLFDGAAMQERGASLYDLVGRSRGPLGRVTAAVLPLRPHRQRPALAGEIAAAALLVACILINIATLEGAAGWSPGWLNALAVEARIEQRWDMFAPVPQSRTAWLVARATTHDGRLIDIFHGARRALAAGPPDGAPYVLQKWLKYYERLVSDNYAPLRLSYGRWLCRRVNDGAAPADLVERFDLHLMVALPTADPLQPRQDILSRRDTLLWEHMCF